MGRSPSSSRNTERSPALETLTVEDWITIDAVFGVDDDPIFGLTPRREFDALFRLIVRLAPPPAGGGPIPAERRPG